MDARLQQHYELEKKLARRILESAPETRRAVFIDAYDTLFREISWHPSLRISEEEKDRLLEQKLRLFAPMVGSGHDVLEIGCGRGDLIGRLAAANGRCVGIDVSAVALAQRRIDASNLTLSVMEACRLEFPDASFDVVLSSQLVEHIHPDDVTMHFREVHRVLRPGGRYVFDTPNRLVGPHDVSRAFDEVSTGFHLKEWSYGELLPLLGGLGFVRMRSQYLPESVYGRGGTFFRFGFLSAKGKLLLERPVIAAPTAKARRARARWMRIAGINISAMKQAR